MVDYEFSPEDDKLFDKLTETMNASEAREIILAKMGVQLGHSAVMGAQLASERPTKHNYSRRGGRAFPEPSDSELDPHWNVQQTAKPDLEDEAANEAFSQFAEQAHEAAVQSYAQRYDVSITEAEAHVKAKKEINQRLA